MDFLFNCCGPNKKEIKDEFSSSSLNKYLNSLFTLEEIDDVFITTILQQVCYYPIYFWNKDWKRRHKINKPKMYFRKKEAEPTRRISLASFEIEDIYSNNNNFEEINLFSFPSARHKTNYFNRNESEKNLLSLTFNDDTSFKDYIIPYSSVATEYIDFKYNLNCFENKPIQFKIENPINKNEVILTIFKTEKEIIWIPIFISKYNLAYKELKKECESLIELLFNNQDFTEFFLSNEIPANYSFLIVGHDNSIFTTYFLYNKLKKSFEKNDIKLFFYQPIIQNDNDFWKEIFDLAKIKKAFIFSFQKPPLINPFFTQFIHFIPEKLLLQITSLNKNDIEITNCRECNRSDISGIYKEKCCKCYFNLFSNNIISINRKKNIRSFVHVFLNNYVFE